MMIKLERPSRTIVLCTAILFGTVAGAIMIWPADTITRHPSPDGRLVLLLISDTAFGQVETLRVIAVPDTPAAHIIFDQPGDIPLHFRRWRDTVTAELDRPARSPEPAESLLLTCGAQACHLDVSLEQ